VARTIYRRAWLAGFALLLAAPLAGPALAAPAGASQYQVVLSQLTPQTEALMVQQEPLAAAAGRIQSALTADAGGFAGVELAVAAKQVILHWHGTVPATVRAMTARLDRSLGRRGRVVIQSADYSQATLLAAAHRLAGRTEDGSKIVAVNVMTDGSGLQVTITPKVAAHGTRTAVPAVRSSVRVSVLVGRAPVPAFGRFGDVAPYNGGAAIRNVSTGVECSSGFATQNSAGQTFLLTAGHCGPDGDVWETPIQHLLIGTTARDITNFADTEIISAPAEPYLYNGGPDPTGQGIGESLAGVSSVAAPVIGELICQQGAFSGPRCNIEVNTFGFISPSGTSGTFLEYGASTTDGGYQGSFEAIGQGDSGGPVITLGPPGFLVAIGTNSAQNPNTPTPCVGVIIPGRECSSTMYFENIGEDETGTVTSVSIAPGG
jgi:hypothetical protein